MKTDLTEEEMRRALFGNAQTSAPFNSVKEEKVQSEVVVEPEPLRKAVKNKVSKAFTPRLRVTLRVSNEFEGKTFEIVHEADTLSTLLAEQEASKAARKKYRYVEVLSVKPM